MNVLVDTSVWALALRRRRSGLGTDERALVLELTDLIRDARIVIVGPVRQELLSGLKTDADFDWVRERLDEFEDEPLETADFLEAARCFNRCRAGGFTGTPIDVVLCAVALRRGLSIFTSDLDFEQYAHHLSLTLHRLPGRSEPPVASP